MSRTRFRVNPQFGQMVERSFTNKVILGSSPVAVSILHSVLLTTLYTLMKDLANRLLFFIKVGMHFAGSMQPILVSMNTIKR